MTDAEFLTYNKSQVRSDEALLDVFIDKFSREFGFIPSCTPCTVDKDFERLRKRLKQPIINNTEMANKTHIPLAKEIIRVNGTAVWTTNATDEQVVAYLTEKGGDLEARKKRWKVLPKSMTEEKVVEEPKKKRRKKTKDAK